MAVSFRPSSAATVNIDVAATSARVQFQSADATGITQVRIQNDGTATAWVEFGDNTVVAAVATGIPVPAGAVEVLSVVGTHVAAIAAGATGKIHFTPGQGI